MKKDLTGFAAAAAGALLGFLIAPSFEGGISLFMKRFASYSFAAPRFCSETFPCVLFFTAAAFILVQLLREETGLRTRYGEEHGSAAWADLKKIAQRYRQTPDGKIMTQHVAVDLDAHRHRRNLNTIVCGGSGAGKTRYFCLPNILQANASYFILDPKGELIRSTGGFLQKKGYSVRVLDLIDMDKSCCYNPFFYLSGENDVQKMVTNLFRSTEKTGAKSSDPFWDTAAQMLLLALIFYLLYEAPQEDRNFGSVMALLRCGMNAGEGTRKSALDLIFEDLEKRDPAHIALKYYRAYRAGSDKTLKSIQITLASRLEKFNLDSVDRLTRTDELHLEEMGQKKTAVFACIPDNDSSFNFLVSMLYTQLFQQLFYQADHEKNGRLKVPVHFLMDEFANIPVPPDFEKILSVMRSRGIFVSIILQNMAQLKALFEKQWESIVGNCDTLLFLGGNEKETHRYLSDMLGKETLKVQSHTRSRTGGSVNYSTIARELLSGDEIRMLPDDEALLFIRGERPVRDRKYDLTSHPGIAGTVQGGAPLYDHGALTHCAARIVETQGEAQFIPYEETFYELIDEEQTKEEFG